MRMGALLSYTNLALNIFISIFFVPFLIQSLGPGEYGVYKTIQSFSGMLMVINFGVGAYNIRTIIRCNESGLKEEKENALFMANVVSGILSVAVVLIGFAMCSQIKHIYSASLTPDEIKLAEKLCVFLVFNIAITIISDSYMGMILAYEKFVVARGAKTVSLILRIVTLVILLKMGAGAVAIVATDLVLAILVFLVFFVCSRFVLKERAKFHYFDKAAFKVCMTFAGATVLQALINQVNMHVDGIILGIMTSAEIVTLYSIALTIYASFSSLVDVFGSLYAPKANKLVAKGATPEQLTDMVIAPGRLQFLVAGVITIGFVLFGKNFICIWVGEDFLPAYVITLILIIPVIIPLIENASIAILDALLRRMVRSMILGGMAIANIIISVILVRRMGYIGAAIGTASSVVLGDIIVMNIYLYKVVHLNIGRMFREIFRGLLPCLLLAGVISVPLAVFLPDSIPFFLLKIVGYLIVAGALVYFFGLNRDEKEKAKKLIAKIIHKGAQ